MKNLFLKIIGVSLIITGLMSCTTQADKKNVFKDAVAIWHMSGLNDSTEKNSRLVAIGEVRAGGIDQKGR
jgi:hypothetical protein